MKKKAFYKIILFLSIFCLISVINLYNAKYLNNFYKYYYIKQSIWYLCGFFTIWLLRNRNVNFLFKYSKYLYWFTNFLLLYLLFFGGEVNGTKAWLNLGPISLQPSEFMKLFLSLYLIEISLSKDKKEIKLLKYVVYTLIPSILVFLEPDTGAIVFYLIIFLTMTIFLKLNWKYYASFFILAILGIASFIYLYNFNQDFLIKVLGTSFFYRVERIINFKTNSYQLDLALISIFSSPLFKNGFDNIGLYIPEGSTDFIFAFSVGNFGLFLAIIILLCYYLVIKEFLKLLKNTTSKKANYFVISFCLMFTIQVGINIMMNIGLIPIIGITLPFLSYGGSSMLVYFIFVGIIFSLTNKDDTI